MINFPEMLNRPKLNLENQEYLNNPSSKQKEDQMVAARYDPIIKEAQQKKMSRDDTIKNCGRDWDALGKQTE